MPESAADALFRDTYQKSLISPHFLVSSVTNFEIECSGRTLTPREIRVLKNAIKRNATYQWYIGGISASALIGRNVIADYKVPQPALYTHRHIDIGYNEDRIVEVTIHPGRPEELSILLEKPLTMTYEITWHPSPKPVGERFNVGDDVIGYFKSGKRWVALSNVYLVAVILLVILIAIHKRAIMGPGEEHAWPQVQKEFSNPPERVALFSALLGLSAQCMMTLLLFSVVSFVWKSPEAMSGYELLCKVAIHYGIASFCGGVVSGKIFASSKSKGWLRPYLYMTCGPFIAVEVLLVLMDIVGTSLPSTALLGSSLTFSGRAKLYLSIYWFITVIPLTFAGTLVGRSLYRKEYQKNNKSSNKNPLYEQGPSMMGISTKPVSSSSTSSGPTKKWYHSKAIIVFLCALAGGSASLTELNFIYEGVWGVSGHYCYISYGIMLLGILGTLLVAGFGAALGTYYTLGVGISSWKWTAVECGAASGVLVLVFSWNYYVSSGMAGVFQATAFMAFSAVVSVIVALSEGFAAYLSSKFFIKNIYSLSKSE